MEALSVAANIIAVIDAAHEIIKICYDFRAALKQSPWALTRILEEVSGLQTIVGKIEELSHRTGGEDAKSSLNLLCNPHNGPLVQCENELVDLQQLLESTVLKGKDGSKRRALIQALGWRFKDSEVVLRLERIQRLKMTLQLALSADQTALLLDIQRLAVESSDGVTTMNEKVDSLADSIKTQEFAKQRQSLLRWLCLFNPSENYEQAQQLLIPGTGQWLLDSDAYAKWSSSNSLLWISGSPGTGKTMLFSTIVAHVLKAPSNPKMPCLAYHYCDFRQKEGTDMLHVLGSLVSQLCQTTASCPKALEAAYTDMLEAGMMTRPKQSSLTDAIIVFSRQHNVTLMIDGLEECGQPEELSQLLKELVVAGDSIKALVTGRDEVYLQEIFHESYQIKLQSHISDTSADIHLYIHSRIQTDRRLSKLNQQIQREISQSLYSQSDGMFRWVQCQLDSISAIRTAKAIREALQSLPAGLEETYSRILRNVPARDRSVVHRTLQWLTLSITPLCLAQVNEAVAIEHGRGEIDDDNRLLSPSDILALCGSLVVLSELETVKLAHLSVEDYLLSEGLRDDRTVAGFALSRTESNSALLLDCITYLKFDELQTGPSRSEADFKQRMDRLPLLAHVARSWPYHFRACEFSEVAKSEVMKFFDATNQNAFFSWVQILNARRVDQWDEWPRHATTLYYASSFGLNSIVQALIQENIDLNAPASRFGGTALHGATLREHVGIMKLLLGAGADPNKQDFNAIFPLHTAVFWGNEKVIHMLLGHGASPGLKGAHDETPLDWAPKDSRVERLLLAHEQSSAPYESSGFADHFAEPGAKSGMSRFETLDIKSYQLGGESRRSIARSLDAQRSVDRAIFRGHRKALSARLTPTNERMSYEHEPRPGFHELSAEPTSTPALALPASDEMPPTSVQSERYKFSVR